MITIETLPDNWQGAFGEVLYTVKSDEEELQITEVSVAEAASSDLLGIKRFYGAGTHTVNISDYLQARIKVQPLETVTSEFDTPGGRMVSVQVTARARAAGSNSSSETEDDSDQTAIVSELRTFTAGMETASVGKLLSHRPDLVEIACGECDELSLVAPAGPLSALVTLYGADGEQQTTIEEVVTTQTPAETELDSTTQTGRGIVALHLNTTDFATTVGRNDQLKVEIQSSDGQTLAARRYRLIAPRREGMRLCWLNSSGGLDYYTFAQVEQEVWEAEKNRAYTRDGYTVYGSQGIREYTLRSAPEPQATRRWLAELISSPAVWIVTEEGYLRADIVTERTVVRSRALLPVEVTLRLAKKVTYQHE